MFQPPASVAENSNAATSTTKVAWPCPNLPRGTISQSSQEVKSSPAFSKTTIDVFSKEAH